MVNFWLIEDGNSCRPLRSEIVRILASRSPDFVNHSYDYKLNWTPLSPISIKNSLAFILITQLVNS